MAEMEASNRRLTHVGGVGIGWQAQDIHPAGVAGNAAAATAEIGAAILDHVTAGYAELLAEISACPLSRLRSR
jgi:creatinine amidohydrolase